MSQHKDLQSASPPPQRKKRVIVKSRKARESTDSIPGIDTSVASMLTPAPSSATNSTACSRQSTPSIASRADTIAVVLPKRGKQAKKKIVQKAPVVAAHAPVAGMLTKELDDAMWERHHDILQTQAEQTLAKYSIAIWPWPKPAPTNPLQLTAAEKKWRDSRNHLEMMQDHDQDLDDWFIKSGNPLAYSDAHPVLSLNYSIIRSFIQRAKRAHRQGYSWEEYEDSELNIDSMSEVRKIQDDTIRAIHEKEAIDNNKRLRIFDVIRPRLCLEIWNKKYPVGRAPLLRDMDGNVVLAQENNSLTSGWSTAFLPTPEPDVSPETRSTTTAPAKVDMEMYTLPPGHSLLLSMGFAHSIESSGMI